MKKKNGELKKAGELRKGAVEKFKSNLALPEKLSKLDVQELIEELRIHQIQLEMQNDELRKTQQVVEESRAKYSDLYDFAPVGYLTLNQGGLILEANLTACSQLGVERSRLIHKPLFLSFITKKEGKDLFNQYLWKVFKTKSLETYEGELKGKDDTPLYAQLESIVVKDNPSQCRTAITDITGRKRVEENLRRAMAVKSEFTSMVSHELRTPMTVIKEGVGMVLEQAAESLSPTHRDYLETAQRNVDRLARLINEVLDYQRLESGQTEFRREELDLNAAIQECLPSVSSLVRQKGLELVTALSPGLPEVPCDKDKIMQVLVNLVSNAVTFTSKGKIAIRTERLDNAIKVSVQDDGIGVQPEDLPKLFQSFSQIPIQGARKTGGTGLGLAISKKIVEMHHGKIGVDSVYGHGSTFYFLLPIIERRR